MSAAWFQSVAVILGALCLAKGILALVLSGRFYGWRRRQYMADRMPAGLYVLPLCVFAATGVSWLLAPGAGPAAWGITAFLTLASLPAAAAMVRWRRHSGAAVAAIDAGRSHVAAIDGALVAIGGLMLGVAFTAF